MNRSSKLPLSPTIKRKLEKNTDGSRQSLNHSNNALNADYNARQYPM